MELLLWLWLLSITFGIGEWVFRYLLPAGRVEGQSLFAVGVGFGILSTSMTLLGLAQLYRTSVIWILLAGLSTALLFRFHQDISRLRIPPNLKKRFFGLSRFEQICIVLAFLICLKNLLGALTPEMRHDVLDYHINFPNLYVLHGGIYETSWHVFSYMPQNMESLYSLALMLSTDTLAKLIHCGFSILTALCIYRLGRRYLDRKTALWAMIWWLLIPHVTFVTSTAYIEMGIALWESLAIAAILRFLEAYQVIKPRSQPATDRQNGWKWLILGGFLSGWALGSKYTVFLLFIVPVMITLLILSLWRNRYRLFSPQKAIVSVLVLGLVALIPTSPWLIRNLAWTGNPFYPILNRQFGLTCKANQDAENFIREHGADLSSWHALYQGAHDQLNQLSIDGTLIIHLLLILLPLLAGMWLTQHHRGKNRQAAPLPDHAFLLFCSLLSGGILLFWLTGTANKDGRFMMPSYMVFCWLLAVVYLRVASWIESIFPRKSLGKYFPALLTGALAASYFFHLVHFYQALDDESPWPVLGMAARETALQQRFSNYPMIQFINRETPRESLILGIGYPTQRPYISHFKHGIHPIESQLGKSDYNTEELIITLQELGVTHLALPNNFGIPKEALNRLVDKGCDVIYRQGDEILYRLPGSGAQSAEKQD